MAHPRLNQDCAVRCASRSGADQRSAFPCLPFAPRPERERGESSLSHFPPNPLGSERSSLPLVFRALGSTPPAQNHGDNGAPVSDRHRAGARNQRRRRWPRSRGSAKPAPMTVRRTDVSGAPPAQSGLRRSPRFAQRCRPEVGVPVPVRRLCSIRTAPLAPLRGAVPAPTGRTGQRSAFPCLRATEPVGIPAEMRRPASACRSRRALKVRGENPPFHTFPRTRLAANEVRCRWFFARSGEHRQPQAGGWDNPKQRDGAHRGAHLRLHGGAPSRRSAYFVDSQTPKRQFR